MTSWNEFLARVEGNDDCASLRLARSMGVPDGTWRTWRRRHRMIRILNGAYALTEPIASGTRLRAHLDALAPGTVLAGRSALWAHCRRLPDGPCNTPHPLEVASDRELAHRPRAGVRVRRSRTFLEGDRCVVDGWPATTPARTVMDLAHELEDDALRALIIDLIFHDIVTADELVHRARRTPTAWGSARLERVAAPLIGERSDSIFEWWVRRALEAAGLTLHPGPYRIRTATGAFEVDIALLDARITIECNGGSHRESAQMDRDATKSNALLDHDWLPLQITWARFREDPQGFVALVVRKAAERTAA